MTSPESAERRVDPEDEGVYTWNEIEQHFKAKYNPTHIQKYWEDTCRRMSTCTLNGEEREDSVVLIEERRADPVDGCMYTFHEIDQHYKGMYNVTQIQEYWDNV